MKKIIMLVAALLFTAGVAMADNHMGSNGMGKCGDSKKEIKKEASCGTGKCGGDMRKGMKDGSCGTGKCGDSMKEQKSHGEQGDMMKKSGNKKPTGSCGTGKCS